MPRGSRDGSIIIIPEVRDASGKKILEPEKIYARRRYRDPRTGKLREKKRLVQNRTAAKQKQHDLLDEIRQDKLKLVQPPEQKTFKDLAKYYRKEELKPPEYANDVRVSGLRSWKKVEGFLTILETEFKDEPLADITYQRLLQFKKKLLARPVVVTKSKKKIAAGEIETRARGITSPNRVLELMRRLLRIARRRLKWIQIDPFDEGDRPLVERSLEQERMLILSRPEEEALLQAAAGPREHLKLALIFAIDTAMRPNEQFATAWEQVHLEEQYITVTSRIAKRERRRIVPVTGRLDRELRRQQEGATRTNGDRDDLVFEHDRNKRAFITACRLAKLKGVRWQDLRHTGIMRMLEAGVDPATVMKITGHTSWTTFMRYVNLNPEMAQNVARALDESATANRQLKIGNRK